MIQFTKKKDKSYYFQILLEKIQYLVKAIKDETKRHITEYILGSDYDYDINSDYESFLFFC